MSYEAGTRLGPYEILSQIGVGYSRAELAGGAEKVM